jgi:hypothetical protein
VRSDVSRQDFRQRIWQLSYQGKTYSVTFYRDVFEEMPSLRFLNFGESLFHKLLLIMQEELRSP